MRSLSSAIQNPFVSLPANFRPSRGRTTVVFCEQRRKKKSGKEPGGVVVKGKKENVWSVDDVEDGSGGRGRSRGGDRRRRGMMSLKNNRTHTRFDRDVMVSPALLMDLDTLLQAQEPVIRPSWNTFASSVSGIWKGVGAVFSPITAQMEPVDIGNNNESLYDCYVRSHIEHFPSALQIQRRTNWVTLNPHGASGTHSTSLPEFSSFDLEKSDLMEEDTMGNEPGLVYFEDGSYSRGPVDIPIGDVDGSNYYLSPTFKFEQCLVKGCHIRLRIVHTIEFNDGGSNIQILRVAMYEEQWVSPVNIRDDSENEEFVAKPFSQRKRTKPSQLTGSWKVFEVNATPIFGDDDVAMVEASSSSPFVYFCLETLNKRSLPDNPVHFREEEIVDMQNATVLWLPGGVTAYVDVKKDGVLCIGVSWYSEEGINLVMERDYGLDGNLKEVRSKSEVKRRWSDSDALSVCANRDLRALGRFEFRKLLIYYMAI